MKTGIFFHEEFKNKDWPVIGDKFRRFPEVMTTTLSLPDVALFTPKPAEEEVLYKAHTPQYVAEVRQTWYYRGAALAVGGCVEAARMIADGRLRNALVFSVGAGHHSGPSEGWGGTYLSCTGPAVAQVRSDTRRARYAVLDTDCHHGDGTRAMFDDDDDVLHVCFCSYNNETGHGTKVDVSIEAGTTDEAYTEKVRREFFARVREFKPFMIFHNLGHDTAIGDYGDRGLSRDFFPALALETKQCAEEVCGGRYLIITHGGSRPDIAEYVFPRIAEILAKEQDRDL